MAGAPGFEPGTWGDTNPPLYPIELRARYLQQGLRREYQSHLRP
jgi:hypothetical protein